MGFQDAVPLQVTWSLSSSYSHANKASFTDIIKFNGWVQNEDRRPLQNRLEITLK